MNFYIELFNRIITWSDGHHLALVLVTILYRITESDNQLAFTCSF